MKIFALAGDGPSNGIQGNCLPGNKDYVIAAFAVKGAKGTACSGPTLDSKYCYGNWSSSPADI